MSHKETILSNTNNFPTILASTMNPDNIDLEFDAYTPSSRRPSIHVESSEFTQASHRSHLQRLVTFLDKPNLRSHDKAQVC